MSEFEITQLTFPFGGTNRADVYLLDLKQLDHYWPKIVESLDEEPELWNASWTKEGIYSALMEQRVQAWAICSKKEGPITAIFFSQVINYETGRSLHIWWLKGHGAIEALEQASAAVEVFAQYIGCKDLLVTGRKGLERALAAFGGKVESITLRKVLPQRTARH